MIKFNIVSVVRNDLNGLKKTMESISSQVYKNYNHIIIDGNSSDGTREYVLSIVDEHVLTVSEPDLGIYDAMNKGLMLCDGDYVVFLNAGDEFYDKSTLDIVSGKILNFKENIEVFYGDSIESAGGQFLKKVAKGHLNINNGMFACHQAMYFQRNFLSKNNIKYDSKLKIAGDYFFVAKIHIYGGRFYKINNWLCIFDMNGQSNTSKKLGRKENWVIQKNVLKISFGFLFYNRMRYLLAAAVTAKLPNLYKSIRYE